ncbi:glycoside hydrolase family 6 protein [Streptomyces sp. NPDC001443]
MVALASVVVAVAAVAGLTSAPGGARGSDEARPGPAGSPTLGSWSAVPPAPSAEASSSPSPKPKASPTATPTRARRTPVTAAVSSRLYHHPDSQVDEWVHDHPGDPRAAVIESRIAEQPAAVWFTDAEATDTTARVREVTAAATASGRVPTVVVYAIPDRDCGGASEGGASDLDAYDGWIDDVAAGLGSGEVMVVLEPDAVAQSDCLSAADRGARFASLARAGRVLKGADPRARVYYDAGHSAWNPAAQQAALLRQAGAASPASSDGVFSNVSNFHRTADEIAYDRAVLDALGGPAGLGAVIDTSRNGNGAPADGQWCDPDGRKIGRAPTLNTGEGRIDAYLWVKLPGESDGCKGEPGTFSASYAYDLAR